MQNLDYGLKKESFPQHHIKFGNFESTRFDLRLHERIGTMPQEKEAIASIPYMQGVVDMSNLLGSRVFENREITYTFYRFGVPKNEARDFQTTIENLLMVNFDTRLEDSFEPDFYYMGKCRDVLVEDDYAFRRLRVTITFDLYPFKTDKHMESADLFDSFNFDLCAFQDGLVFQLRSGWQTMRLYNAGQNVVRPTVQGAVQIRQNGRQVSPTGLPRFVLVPGMNTFEIQGTGTVRFDWRKERI
jgi:phage-related protein